MSRHDLGPERLNIAMRPGTQYLAPTKTIQNPSDMPVFHNSDAYATIMTLVTSFSALVVDCQCPSELLDSAPSSVKGVSRLLDELTQLTADVEPLSGPRRFGNVAFRTWHARLKTEAHDLISRTLVLSGPGPLVELVPYFTGAFGSQQRLDFGTGHELSFLAFLGVLFLSQGPEQTPSGPELLFVFKKYFDLVGSLVLRYTLEPAGSHGVWGLDDHFHLPYILGSAQLSRLASPPPPSSVMDKVLVAKNASTNLYFNAINFIYKVKRGPFYEHSPVLYDVTGVPLWSKIHTGMIKMYAVEVLGKFPVVQHFPCGGVFSWTDSKSHTKLPLSTPVDDSSAALSRAAAQLPVPTSKPFAEATAAPWARKP